MSTSDSLNDQSNPSSFTQSTNSESQDFSHSRFDHILPPASRATSQRNSPYPHSFFFEEAFRSSASPSPPATSFLDNILNPAEPSFHSFGYRRNASPPRRRARSPVIHYAQPVRSAQMSPTSRLPNGYVDLTSEPDVPSEHTPQRAKRPSPIPGPSAKRLKRPDGSAAKRESKTPEAKIEEIDLSDDRIPLQDVLQKQRLEAVKAQQKPEEKATTFTTFTCVICMDTPTDITATSCGHLFCHTCLMEALIAGENRSGPNEPKRSQCPVCRKFINRTKQADIIPLLMKKGLATQPRKKPPASAPKAKS